MTATGRRDDGGVDPTIRVLRRARVPIDAPAAIVGRVVSDITRIGEFSPEAFEAAWIDGADGPVVGARREIGVACEANE